MNEKEKYLNLYRTRQGESSQSDTLPGHMGGGYGRICWGENMLETLKGWKISSLLDVGCGYGNFCDAAALFVPRVYGLDIASVATGNVIDNPEITYLDGEAKALPLPDNAVEWITSFDCLEHCLEQDIDQILKEFNRVSKKGFVLSISYEPCEMDGMPLHMTVKPESWWIDKLSRFGEVTKENKAPITGAPYLICRKFIEKKIICYCAGSLGTRLLAMAQTDRLARQTGRSMMLVWPKDDPLCRSAFSSLFRSPVSLITQAEMLDLSSCKIYANIKEVADQALISGGMALRSAVRKWGSFGTDDIAMDDDEDHLVVYVPGLHIDGLTDNRADLLERLEPIAPVQERIREIMARCNIDKSVIGVHARGTDFGIQADVYARQIQKALNRNTTQKFYVCSDDLSYEKRLKVQFPDHVIVRNKTAWMQKGDEKLPWALGNVTTNTASVQEALIDLYLLALTRFEIYHESSAFARTGAWLSKCSVTKSGDISPLEAASPNNPPATDEINPANRTISVDGTQQTIYYFCPSRNSASAGIRRLHRHVSILHDAGFSARLLFERDGTHHRDMPDVPVAYLESIGNDPDAIFVIPEGMPGIMHRLREHPGRRFVIALSWVYIFSTLPDGVNWRDFNIERVLAVSPSVADMVEWSMALPVHLLASGIDHDLYYYDPSAKQMQISYISRKAEHVKKLQALLASRNADYLNKYKWVELDGLSQEVYAEQVRRSAVFLSTSLAEGFPTSCLEAMAAGALVAGYDGVGGKKILSSAGEETNAIIAPNGDYLTLAYKLAPALDDLLSGRMKRWDRIREQARETALNHTVKKESSALISFWTSVLQRAYGAHSSRGTFDMERTSSTERPTLRFGAKEIAGIGS